VPARVADHRGRAGRHHPGRRPRPGLRGGRRMDRGRLQDAGGAGGLARELSPAGRGLRRGRGPRNGPPGAGGAAAAVPGGGGGQGAAASSARGRVTPGAGRPGARASAPARNPSRSSAALAAGRRGGGNARPRAEDPGRVQCRR
jgi:hypothetical protein